METMQNNIEKPIFFFVITLKHENRLKNIENQQKKIKEKEIILFEAVKGDFINMDDLIKEKILDPNFKEEGVRKRVIGCYMSHLNMYKKIRNERLDGYTVLFEDDFTIEDNFYEKIQKIIKNMENKEFDIINLGQVVSNNKGKQVIDNIYELDKKDFCAGTQGLLINNRNIDKIVEKLKYIDNAIDHKITHTGQKNELNIFVIYPYIVNQGGVSNSTINDMSIENFFNYPKIYEAYHSLITI
jgi:GR25 family glycosyltransferase involved in LPS biosynthesis